MTVFAATVNPQKWSLVHKVAGLVFKYSVALKSMHVCQ